MVMVANAGLCMFRLYTFCVQTCTCSPAHCDVRAFSFTTVMEFISSRINFMILQEWWSYTIVLNRYTEMKVTKYYCKNWVTQALIALRVYSSKPLNKKCLLTPVLKGYGPPHSRYYLIRSSMHPFKLLVCTASVHTLRISECWAEILVYSLSVA